MPALAHSFKTLRREWRSGELRLIAAALTAAVAAVTAVTLFTDRVRQAMVLRANTLLAADMALDSSFPIALPYLEEARRLGLETAQTLPFRSMLVVGKRMQLVEVKAVEGGLSPARPAGRGKRPIRHPRTDRCRARAGHGLAGCPARLGLGSRSHSLSHFDIQG